MLPSNTGLAVQHADIAPLQSGALGLNSVAVCLTMQHAGIRPLQLAALGLSGVDPGKGGGK